MLLRHKLAFDEDKFQAILKLLDMSENEDINSMIQMLRTNPTIYKHALMLSPEFQNIFLDQKGSTYRVLYSIKIIEHLLEQWRTAAQSYVVLYYNEEQSQSSVPQAPPSGNNGANGNKENQDNFTTPQKQIPHLDLNPVQQSNGVVCA